jgi:uncharacterized membrane protein YebE (DUF533 family)
MKKILFALALVAGLAATAQAQRRYDDRYTSPRERAYDQDVRIRQGAIRGDLTPREVARLKRQQAEVDRAVRRAKRDGFIDRRERIQIAQLQQRMDWAIARERRDWDRRGSVGRRPY